MFIGIFVFVFKAVLKILQVVCAVAFVIVGFITIGAFVVAMFKLFPIACIIIAIVLLSVAIYNIALFVKKKKLSKELVGAIHESPEKPE